MFQSISNWMVSWSESPYAGVALLLLSFAESSFFPLPPDILLIALTLGNPSWGMIYAMLTTVGSVLGGIFGYWIGRMGGTPLLLRIMGQERIKHVHELFERHEGWAIAIAGLTPIPYKLFTLGAGAFYVNLRVFILVSILSRGARFFIVAGLLQLFGPWIRESMDRYFNLFTIIVVAVVGLVAYLIAIYAKKTVVHNTLSDSNTNMP